MKKILFIAAIFSIFSTSHGQQPDAVFKLLHYEWTLNADGTSDYHYRHEVQILRNRALTAYADKGETFVVLNPDLEELTINEVYTRRADGSRVDMPQNAFIYQLPEECADCGRFNHLRELAMVHTGMEIGCVIVVDYTIHRQYNTLYESIPLLRECPVENLEVVVKAPSDMSVESDLLGEKYLPNGLTKNDVLKSSFSLRNLPQAPREPYMPADIIPTLRIYNWAPEFTPGFDQEPFKESFVTISRIKNLDTPRENILAIRDFVLNNIHLNDIHPRHLGYTHATAAEVWATGCGTATDKAVLLAGMLNYADYPARVIGDNNDEVAVLIDTLEYRLSVRHANTPELIGEAHDEVAKATIEETREATLDTLEDGFFRLVLDAVPSSPATNAGLLTSFRNTPLATSACELASNVTYTLPKGVTLVGGDINRKLNYGIGSLEISIKQSGSKLKVVRNLTVAKSIVPVNEYADYRHLIATWQEIGSLLLKTK